VVHPALDLEEAEAFAVVTGDVGVPPGLLDRLRAEHVLVNAPLPGCPLDDLVRRPAEVAGHEFLVGAVERVVRAAKLLDLRSAWDGVVSGCVARPDLGPRGAHAGGRLGVRKDGRERRSEGRLGASRDDVGRWRVRVARVLRLVGRRRARFPPRGRATLFVDQELRLAPARSAPLAPLQPYAQLGRKLLEHPCARRTPPLQTSARHQLAAACDAPGARRRDAPRVAADADPHGANR
jgi:hypothetical protein